MVLYSLLARAILPFVFTRVMPLGTNMLTILTASDREPPPLSRKSKTNPLAPFSFSSIKALRTSDEQPSVNEDKLM